MSIRTRHVLFNEMLEQGRDCVFRLSYKTRCETDSGVGVHYGLFNNAIIIWGYRHAVRLAAVLGLTTLYLTPSNRVFREKLNLPQLVKKFPALYGTRKFITTCRKACQLHMSWARSVQSTPVYPISWSSTLILFSHLRLGLPRVYFPQVPNTEQLCGTKGYENSCRSLEKV